jgi:hypothetical protein
MGPDGLLAWIIAEKFDRSSVRVAVTICCEATHAAAAAAAAAAQVWRLSFGR